MNRCTCPSCRSVRPARREDGGAWLGVIAGALAVALICAVCVIESCAASSPQMRECEARGDAVVRGQHGGWRCEPEREQ